MFAAAFAAARSSLLFAEGHTIGTLVNGRITLVGADQNTIQRTEIGITAVISALLYGTFNTLVGVAIHYSLLLFLG